mmetsp:Transcript_2844/g.8482  ORF Transcript_2844/g.8482 Transcript_2844/m.8482 type:complete len:686 (+) Transcript_2844:1556-3613(+)
MAAAVIKLNTLTDPVGPSAQDEDLLAGGGIAFALAIVRRVHVWRISLELGGTRVNAFHAWHDALGRPRGPDGQLVRPHREGDLGVAESPPLDLEEVSLREIFQRFGLHPALNLVELTQLIQEPWVDVRVLEDFVGRDAVLKSLFDDDHSLGIGDPHVVDDLVRRQPLPVLRQGPSIQARLQGPERLLERLLEGPSDGHRLSHGFHLRGKHGLRTWELLKGEARDLGDHIVDRRLKRRRRLERDVVRDLVQRISAGEPRRHLGDREPSRLGRQCRRSRHPRVHLDDHHVAIGGVDGHLDVGPTAFDAHFPDNSHRGIPQTLILFVGDGLHRRNGDRITSMHAHRVHILDGANDDHIISQVPHHLQLVLLPPKQRLLDLHLRRHRRIQAALANLQKLVHIVRNTTARPSQRERRSDDERKVPNRLMCLHRLLHVVRDARLGHLQPQSLHRIRKQFPVLRLVDRLQLGPNQLDPVFIQNAALGERLGQVQRCLPAHRRQDRVRLFLDNNLLHKLWSHRAHVGTVRRLRIRHDGGRVGVDQHHAVALCLERLARLRPRVIKLTRLSDHNRTSPEQHNRLDISTLRHPLHGRIPRREATRCSHSLNDTSHARTATPGRATPHTQIHPSIFHRHARLSRRQERGAPAGLPACLLCDASERHGCQVQTNATRLNHANECRCLDEVYSMRYEL